MASNYEYTVLTQNSYDPLFGEMREMAMKMDFQMQ